MPGVIRMGENSEESGRFGRILDLSLLCAGANSFHGGGGGNLNEPYRSTLLHYNYLFS